MQVLNKNHFSLDELMSSQEYIIKKDDSNINTPYEFQRVYTEVKIKYF